jgi:hypothetical protein
MASPPPTPAKMGQASYFKKGEVLRYIKDILYVCQVKAYFYFFTDCNIQ